MKEPALPDSIAAIAFPSAADLQIWRTLCRKNFNFLFKMKGMWAEPANLHFPLQEKAEPAAELQLIK